MNRHFQPILVLGSILVAIALSVMLNSGLQLTTTVAAAPLAQADSDSTVARFQERGFLIVGVKFDAPPFGSVDAEGNPSGFEIDLSRELAARWLGDATAVEFVQVTSGNRIDRLLSRDIDLIIATMTKTPARDEQIDFSLTYYLDGQNILVNSERIATTGSDTERIARLDNRTIGAVQGSTSIERIQDFALEQRITITPAGFEQYDQAVQPLLEQQIDGLTTDRGILVRLADQDERLRVLLDENFSDEPYGIGIYPDDQELRALVNDTLLAMQNDGTYTQLFRRWFPAQAPFLIGEDDPLPGDPLPTEPVLTTTVGINSTAIVEPTATPEPSATATALPTEPPTNTPEPTATETATVEPTATLEPTATATDTLEPTATNTVAPTETPLPTETATPEPTATTEPTATAEPTAPDPPTNTPDPTPTDAPTIQPTDTATAAPPPTATPTLVPAPTRLPETGGALQNVIGVPVIVLLLLTLFGSSIYWKRRWW